MPTAAGTKTISGAHAANAGLISIACPSCWQAIETMKNSPTSPHAHADRHEDVAVVAGDHQRQPQKQAV